MEKKSNQEGKKSDKSDKEVMEKKSDKKEKKSDKKEKKFEKEEQKKFDDIKIEIQKKPLHLLYADSGFMKEYLTFFFSYS